MKCKKHTLTCKCPCFVGGHGPEVAQVTLVADQHNDDVAVCMVSQLLQPTLHVFIGQVLGDVIDQQGPHCTTVIPVDQRKQR